MLMEAHMGQALVDGRDGEWLCSPGAYLDHIRAMSSFDTRLKSRDFKAIKQGTPWPMKDIRVVNMHCREGDAVFAQTGEWTSPEAFKSELQNSTIFGPGQRNVLLIEGFTPALVEVLGTVFDIHPSFFVDHERVSVFEDTTTSLPSRMRGNTLAGHTSLRYVEPVVFEKFIPEFYLSCRDTGRHIGVTRTRGNKSSIGLLRRKCSYWKTSNGPNGFTIIVLCDPPVRRVRNRRDMTPSQSTSVVTTPFRGGYLDFLPQEVQSATRYGPPRTCLLDDLAYYLSTHASILCDIPIADRLPFFVQKLVAAQYHQLGLFKSNALSLQQWDLTRKDDMGGTALSPIEQQWSDVQGLERRLNEYCSDLDDIMLKLGTPYQDPDTSQCTSADAWLRVDIDFQFLRKSFQTLRHRAEHLNAATTGLTGIAGNRQSQRQQEQALREVQRTKALTLVGLIFIPLAFTATLFSMADKYMPGAKDFWVYFCVAIPLMIAVILGYIVLDKVYDEVTWAKARALVLRIRTIDLRRPRIDEKNGLTDKATV